MNPVLRPDKIQSRDDFRVYVDAMLQSLTQALANPAIPYGPAVDDQGVRWENTRLDTFQESMDAWMEDWGWTEHDRTESLVWAALALTPGVGGDEDDLRQYLAELRDWASNPTLAEDQQWTSAAQAPAAEERTSEAAPGASNRGHRI